LLTGYPCTSFGREFLPGKQKDDQADRGGYRHTVSGKETALGIRLHAWNPVPDRLWLHIDTTQETNTAAAKEKMKARELRTIATRFPKQEISKGRVITPTIISDETKVAIWSVPAPWLRSSPARGNATKQRSA
jgi:hypothetical protein